MNRVVTVALVAVLLTAAFLSFPALAAGPGMKFASDVTIPDDTVMQPGQVFTKTWKLQNTGGVDWLDYSLQHVSGDEMQGAPDAVAPVKTNGLCDVSVVFTAPETDGTYQSWWALVDEAGRRVGSQFYVRIVVGTGKNSDQETTPTLERLMARLGTVYSMNEAFTLNGIEFRVVDVYRQGGIWGTFCGPCTVKDGVWAMIRFNVTNHTGYSALIADHVLVYVADTDLTEYQDSYEPGRIARKALVSAGAHFGNQVGTVWSEMGTEYVDAAMIHVEPVPAATDVLYAVFKDLETGKYAFVRLQPCVSKDDMRFEGDFINAPERK